MTIQPLRLFALLLVGVLACTSDGTTTEPTPTPTIELTATPTALTVVQGMAGTVQVAVTRSSGFDGSVAVSASGLPSGVTASVSPSPLTGSASSATVTVNASASTPPGTYAITVTASGSGVATVSTTFQLTIVAAPSFTLALGQAALTVDAGSSGTTSVELARTNLSASVSLSLVAPPSGITGVFTPNATTGNTAQLEVNVAPSVEPGTYPLTIRGTATGASDNTATLQLTVNPQPDFSLAASGAPIAIVAGASGNSTVTITRTNFAGDVALSLVSPPAGITATFDPASTTGTTSALTIHVANDVPEGNYTLTVQGVGAAGTRSVQLPVLISVPPPPQGIVNIALGGDNSCATHASNVLYCFGYGMRGELGHGAFAHSIEPVMVLGGHVFAQMDGGSGTMCGVTVSGAAYCWGENSNGQLGNGSTDDEAAPVPVSGGHSFSMVSTGLSHSCGVRTDGRGFCWGNNNGGRLGTGTETNSTVPVEVAGGHTFLMIDAGPSGPQTCGVLTNGKAVCWGHNNNGMLGNGTQSSSLVPVEVSGGYTFSRVVIANSAVCGITSGGIVRCWGNGSSGRLGNGSTDNSLVPVQVSGNHNFIDIAGGHNGHFCAVTSSGEARCWGNNSSGQIGDGTNDPRNVPTLVPGGHTFVQISVGGSHSCARTVDNRAFCWGFGILGRLGTGNESNSPIPVEVTAGPFGAVGGGVSRRQE